MSQDYDRISPYIFKAKSDVEKRQADHDRNMANEQMEEIINFHWDLLMSALERRRNKKCV